MAEGKDEKIVQENKNKAEANHNLLTVLRLSEELKPYAKNQYIELPNTVVSLCKKALEIMLKDQRAYQEENARLQANHDSALAIIADRQTNGQVEYSTESSASIEDHKNGISTRERATPESKSSSPSFSTVLQNVNYAVEALKRAVSEKRWSVLDAEKALRCIAYMGQPEPRQLSNDLYGADSTPIYIGGQETTPAGTLATLVKWGNELIEDDAYVVSRRLSLKFGPNTLDKMDGENSENIVTGEKAEYSFMKGMKFNVDPGTGIRYLAPESMYTFNRKLEEQKMVVGSSQSIIVKSGKNSYTTVDLHLSAGEEMLFENAVRKTRSRIEAQRAEKNSEEVLGNQDALMNLLNAYSDYQQTALASNNEKLQGDKRKFEKLVKADHLISHIDEGATPEETRLNISKELDKMEKVADMTGFSLLQVGRSTKIHLENYGNANVRIPIIPEIEKKEDGSEVLNLAGSLDYLFEAYMSSYQVYAALKNHLIEIAKMANVHPIDTKSRKEAQVGYGIPYDVESINTGRGVSKTVNAIAEGWATIMRIQALPLAFISENDVDGQEMIHNLLDLKSKVSMETNNNLQSLMGPDGVLSSDPEEFIKKTKAEFTAALKGKTMYATQDGWFKTTELTRIFKSHAEAALKSIINIEDTKLLEEAAHILESSSDAVMEERAGAFHRDAAGNPEVKDLGGTKVHIVEAPSTDKMSAAVRLRILSCSAISHGIDESVPEKLPYNTVYAKNFNDMGGPGELYNKVVKYCLSGLDSTVGNAKLTKKDRDAMIQKKANSYHMVMELVNAIKSAGGGNTDCVRIMEQAEDKARDAFINEYIENVMATRNSLGLLCLLDVDKIDGSGASIAGDYTIVGKILGEKLLFGLSARVLDRIGQKDDYLLLNSYRADDEAEKDSNAIYSNLSVVGRYVVSEMASVITEISEEKLKKDVKYFEGQLAYDSLWHGRNDSEADNSIYVALMKGTVPPILESSLIEKFRERVFDSEIAQKIGICTLYSTGADRLQVSDVFNSYAESLGNALYLSLLETRKQQMPVNIKAAWKDVNRLNRVLMNWTGSDREREKVEEYLTALEHDNPVITNRIDAFRSAFVSNEDESYEGMCKLAEKLDELKYTCPFTEENRHLGKEYLIEKEEAYYRDLNAQATAYGREYESLINTLTDDQMAAIEGRKYKTDAEKEMALVREAAKNIALADVAIADLFDKKSIMAKDFAPLMQIKSADDMIDVSPAIIGLMESNSKAVEDDFYLTIASDGIKAAENCLTGAEYKMAPLPYAPACGGIYLGNKVITKQKPQREGMEKTGRFIFSSECKVRLENAELAASLNTRKLLEEKDYPVSRKTVNSPDPYERTQNYGKALYSPVDKVNQPVSYEDRFNGRYTSFADIDAEEAKTRLREIVERQETPLISTYGLINTVTKELRKDLRDMTPETVAEELNKRETVIKYVFGKKNLDMSLTKQYTDTSTAKPVKRVTTYNYKDKNRR